MVDYVRFQEAVHRDICLHYLQRSSHAGDEFYAFTDLWMSFNSWMACVTGQDIDSKMIEALCDDIRLGAAFLELQRNDGRFRHELADFADNWPVYRAQDVLKKIRNRNGNAFGLDEEFLRALKDDQSVRRRPAGWVRGKEPNWRDFLAAVYQVRCNLAHGHKSSMDHRDRLLVSLSFSLLHRFVHQSECYDWY